MSEELKPDDQLVKQFREVKHRLKHQSKGALIAMLFEAHHLMQHYKQLYAGLQEELAKQGEKTDSLDKKE